MQLVAKFRCRQNRNGINMQVCMFGLKGVNVITILVCRNCDSSAHCSTMQSHACIQFNVVQLELLNQIWLYSIHMPILCNMQLNTSTAECAWHCALNILYVIHFVITYLTRLWRTKPTNRPTKKISATTSITATNTAIMITVTVFFLTVGIVPGI